MIMTRVIPDYVSLKDPEMLHYLGLDYETCSWPTIYHREQSPDGLFVYCKNGKRKEYFLVVSVLRKLVAAGSVWGGKIHHLKARGTALPIEEISTELVTMPAQKPRRAKAEIAAQVAEQSPIPPVVPAIDAPKQAQAELTFSNVSQFADEKEKRVSKKATDENSKAFVYKQLAEEIQKERDILTATIISANALFATRSAEHLASANKTLADMEAKKQQNG